MRNTLVITLLLTAFVFTTTPAARAADEPAGPLHIAVFDIDATPPIGSPLAYDVVERTGQSLRCRGVALLGEGRPIVLCAVDWIGIANAGHDAFRTALAEAAETSPDRVAVHALHQHDAPVCDFTAAELLAEHGLGGLMFNVDHARDTIRRAADALREALRQARPVTHIMLGEAPVEDIASNRRILGPDGRVRDMRWTATQDPDVRAEPVGVIDPALRLIAFANEDGPLAVLTYYATHPQSYYRTRAAHPDFPGMARAMRDEATGVTHVHFTGAGGNIGAGKFNDGSPENRPVLARRLADAMAAALDTAEKTPITAADLRWSVRPVALPPAPHLDEEALLATLADDDAPPSARKSAAADLAWLRRCRAGHTIDLACLALGRLRLLHMPGELLVEYQLAAQAIAPDRFIAVAAYGDYGPGYIPLAHHFWQGGYEAGPGAARVAPHAEAILMPAMAELLAQ